MPSQSAKQKQPAKTRTSAKATVKKSNTQETKTYTKKDFELALKGLEDIFTKEELENIRTAYAQMKSIGRKKAKKIRDIVPIQKWINDPYYVGEDVSQLYPYWKEVIIDIFREDRTDAINQIILTGSIGIGKSTAAALIIIRKIYELSCYEDISAMFNLFGVSRIAFAYLSVTREQAQNTGFSLLTEWVDSIPYFREHFRRKDNIDSMIIWPQERLLITYGSVANHFIGMNLLGSILDEANFFSGRSKEDTDYTMNSKVSALYSQIIARSESRFIVNGINHSLSLLVSSSTVESSFTEERILKAKKDNDVHTYIVSPSLWEVKPWNYKGGKFPVYAGGDNIDPMIISSLEDLNMILVAKKYEPIFGIDLKSALQNLPVDVSANIIMVPDEHKNSFSGDINIALQDIAGHSSSRSTRLFNSEVAYSKVVKPTLSHPFSSEQFVVSTGSSFTKESLTNIQDYLLPGFTLRNPQAKRFMHMDLALSGDSVGLSMCHISGWKTIYGETMEQKQQRLAEQSAKDRAQKKELGIYSPLKDLEIPISNEEAIIPIISFDFMVRINPPNKPNKIAISKIRDFIVFLAKAHNVSFGMISADQFQSAQLLQELESLGFPVKSLSVDRTPEPYMAFTQLIYDGRVELYDYPPFKKELFGVIYYPARKKVDHPKGGSKDVADSAVGSAYLAIESKSKNSAPQQALVDLFINVNTSNQQRYDNEVKSINDMLLKSLFK